ATEHTDAEDVDPAERELQQIGVEYARHDALNDHPDPQPGRQSPASEHEKMRYPHAPQQRGADKSKLDGDLERLVVRLVGYVRGSSFALAGELAKQIEDSAGAMPKHRSVRDQPERLSPELESQPCGGRLILDAILLNFLHHRIDPRPHMRGGGPGQAAKHRA